jgi:hypothetical protein
MVDAVPGAPTECRGRRAAMPIPLLEVSITFGSCPLTAGVANSGYWRTAAAAASATTRACASHAEESACAPTAPRSRRAFTASTACEKRSQLPDKRTTRGTATGRAGSGRGPFWPTYFPARARTGGASTRALPPRVPSEANSGREVHHLVCRFDNCSICVFYNSRKKLSWTISLELGHSCMKTSTSTPPVSVPSTGAGAADRQLRDK